MNEPSQPAVSVPQIRFPTGGGAIKSIGETFQPSPFTGTASFTIPVATPEARDLSLELSLSYSSGGSQGPFGLGFSLSVPSILRRTEKRLPDYSDRDEYVLSNAEYLVPALAEQDGVWVNENREENGDTYRVRRYRTRTESSFLRIERWTRRADGDVHWRVTTANNVTSVYGVSTEGRIYDPDQPQRVFQWLLERTEDSKGNQIRYRYRRENTAGIANAVYEQGRSHTTQRYLHTIQYGNYFDAEGKVQWAFSVVFDYGDYSLDHLEQLTPTPSRDWLARPDAFSDYRPGFEVRTHRLCRNILVFHHLPAELGRPDVLVRSLRLTYEESPVITFLQQVQPVGYRLHGDRYEVQPSPPITFEYSQYNPEAQTFQPLHIERQGMPPLPLDGSGYQLLDLYGEGIAGLFYDREGISLYCRPQGDGSYGPGRPLTTFPIERTQPLPTYNVTDGLYTRLTVRTGERSGYYQLETEDDWQSFQPFQGVPTDYRNFAFDTADVTGDGRPDLLLFAADQVRVYPTATDGGHQKAFTALRSPQLPVQADPGQETVVALVDMVGDGLSDRVQVRNGEVTYWPNLGYGNFGPPVTMANAPHVAGRLSANRVYLVDIDGSGTADLVYVTGREAVVYFNESGNRFSDPVRIPLPAPPPTLSQVQFADVRGNGTSCLIFSGGTTALHHEFYDFTGGIKPHLLTTINNHRGAVTRLQYAPSTQFYLADQRAGDPWISRLPFPVQVLEKTETLDLIAKTRRISRYAYHHGAYDFREREFAGFGLVEQWDTEGFEQFSQAGLLAEMPFEVLPSDLHAAPIHTKTWYHTGLMERDGVLSRQYAASYYQGDEQAIALPDSNFERAGDAASVQVAYRALRGKELRQEIYGEDGDAQRHPHPYQVTETAYRLRLIQPTQGFHGSVYLPLLRERITYQYEREPADPRITHRFYLAHDRYGQLTREATIAYPRRRIEAHPDQRRWQGRYTYRQFLHLTESAYRLNIPLETREFELSRFQPATRNTVTWDELVATDGALPQTAVDFDQTAAPGARLLSWQRFHYWNDFEQANQARPLPWGQSGKRSLLRRVETAVYPQAALADLLPEGAGDLTAKLLSQDADGGAFISLTHAATGRVYYADPGTTAHYQGAEQFYQPRQFIDQFGTVTTVTYDRYALVLVRTDAHLSARERLTQRIQPDYWTLKPAIAYDENDTVTEYRYDPQGNVRLTSRYEQEGNARQGDRPLAAYVDREPPTLAQLLADPHTYLQGASSYVFYDLLAWETQQQPVYAVQIQRDRFVSDLEPGEVSPVQVQIDYSDGLGRSLQTKQWVEAGPALVVQPDGAVEEQETRDRWLTSGRTVYNNKGQVVKQYEPFYSAVPTYQPERLLTEYGVTAVRHYDPLGRVVQTDLPKGFLNRNEYQAWQVREFDANDTIRQSPYFQIPRGQLSTEEQDALNKAEAHANTPQEQALDGWGRPFLYRQQLTPTQILTTYQKLDISGNVLQLRDPRQSAREGPATLEMRHDMAGRVIYQIGGDIGQRWTVVNAGGDEIHRWDGRGFHHATHYDALSRPIALWVTGNGLNHQLEAIEYGETATASANNNLRGRIKVHSDGAGVLEIDRYDFNGNPLNTRRRLRQRYDQVANWRGQEATVNEIWQSQRRFDARSRLVEITHPDNRRVRYAYHPSGRLRSVTHVEPGRAEEAIVVDLAYNARDQRVRLRSGNGVETTYAYDPLTFNLSLLNTRRQADGRMLQDLQYTYDPVGNVTRIRDRTSRILFQNNQVVLPQVDYTYDALYRLTVAAGREHRGLYRPDDAIQPTGDMLLPLPPSTRNPEALAAYTRRFTYDDASNLTQIVHTAVHRRFTRNIAIAEASNRGGLEAARIGQSYDANGNVTRLPHLPELTWNSLNQLAQVEVVRRNDAPDDREYYNYDASGQRVRKVFERRVNGARVIEETLYFGDFEVHRVRRNEQVQEAYTTVQVSDGQSRVASLHRWTQRPESRNIPARQTRYQLGNHQSSATLELDGEGQILTYEEYFPYGGTAIVAGRSQQEVSRKRYRYSGRERDASTQLYYYGDRYYAPWMGRWLSPDPAGAVDGANLYAFVKGNPVRYVDQNGQRASVLNNPPFSQGTFAFFQQLSRTTRLPLLPTKAAALQVLETQSKIQISSSMVRKLVGALPDPPRLRPQAGAKRPLLLLTPAPPALPTRPAAPPPAAPAEDPSGNSPATAVASPPSGGNGGGNSGGNGGGNSSPPPPPPTPPPAPANPPATRARSNAVSSGPTTLGVDVDFKTAILLAAAILVALVVLMKIKEREALSQDIRDFDRSQLNSVTPRVADSPNLGRVLDDNSPVGSDLSGDEDSDVLAGSGSDASESEASSEDADNVDGLDAAEDSAVDDAPQVDQASTSQTRRNTI
ncbi:MAG: SpvB/TcaC N-terminal domain-containing protein [Synechococcales bacterium]|nr:SpvB/TcaC N-terminal domain-containing protein [Synechococcales bacterium]